MPEEFRKRKESIRNVLKANVLEKQETSEGFKYKFSGNNRMVNEILNFILTERECCNFFNFGFNLEPGGEFAWLKLEGAAGTKEFIQHELEL